MAFNSANFSFYAPTNWISANAMWKYSTSDDLSGIGSSYFSLVGSDKLREGDIIAVDANDGKDVFYINTTSANCTPLGIF